VRARAADPGDRADPGVAAFARSLDAALFAYKADLVARYGLAARGRDATPAEAAAGARHIRVDRRRDGRAPQRLAHRDYQSSNLYVREGAAARRAPAHDRPPGRVARPARIRPGLPAARLVRRAARAEIAEHCAAVRPTLPDAPDAEIFARRFDLLTLTRKGKDHARFLYAARERGDERFLGYAPITVRQLRRAAARASERDARVADLAALLHELPESPCAR
jgi:hypothetical protein